jgi:hypothetical protein
MSVLRTRPQRVSPGSRPVKLERSTAEWQRMSENGIPWAVRNANRGRCYIADNSPTGEAEDAPSRLHGRGACFLLNVSLDGSFRVYWLPLTSWRSTNTSNLVSTDTTVQGRALPRSHVPCLWPLGTLVKTARSPVVMRVDDNHVWANHWVACRAGCWLLVMSWCLRLCSTFSPEGEAIIQPLRKHLLVPEVVLTRT